MGQFQSSIFLNSQLELADICRLPRTDSKNGIYTLFFLLKWKYLFTRCRLSGEKNSLLPRRVAEVNERYHKFRCLMNFERGWWQNALWLCNMASQNSQKILAQSNTTENYEKKQKILYGRNFFLFCNKLLLFASLLTFHSPFFSSFWLSV